MDTSTCTHTHKPHSEQLGVFAVWAGLSFSSPSHTMTHALSVFALHLAQTALVSVPLPFKHFEVCFCEDVHKPGKAWPQVALAKRGPSSLRNQLEFEKCTWYMLPCVFPFFLIMFWHSSQGHRDIRRVLFHFAHNGSHKDKLSELVHSVHKLFVLKKLHHELSWN